MWIFRSLIQDQQSVVNLFTFVNNSVFEFNGDMLLHIKYTPWLYKPLNNLFCFSSFLQFRKWNLYLTAVVSEMVWDFSFPLWLEINSKQKNYQKFGLFLTVIALLCMGETKVNECHNLWFCMMLKQVLTGFLHVLITMLTSAHNGNMTIICYVFIVSR